MFNIGDRVVVINRELATNRYIGTVLKSWSHSADVKLDDGGEYNFVNSNLELIEASQRNGEGFSIKKNQKVTYTFEVDEDIYAFIQWVMATSVNESVINEFLGDDDNETTKFIRFMKEINSY